jgi:ABC-type sugar transport system substrate-binding protein
VKLEGQDASLNKPKLTVALMTQNNDFQLEQAVSAELAAKKFGCEVEIIYANNDAALQTQQLIGYIQEPGKRPDAIVVEPVGTAMSQVPGAATSAGIARVLVKGGVDYISDLRSRSKLRSLPSYLIAKRSEESRDGRPRRY